MRNVLIFLLIIWVVITFGGGKAIDNVCVKGKLKERHAEAVMDAGWRKAPVEARDRIVNHECSEFLRAITFRDAEWRK